MTIEMRQDETLEERELSAFEARLEGEKTYWFQKLADPPDAVSVPLDRTGPPSATGPRHRLEIFLDPVLQRGLRRLCSDNDTLVLVTFLTVWKAYLHRLTGAEDIIVGTAIHQRHGELAAFNKVLAVRGRVTGETSLKALLLEVKKTLGEAYVHQKLPFELLLRHFGLRSLFGTVVVMEGINDVENVRYLPSDLILALALRQGALLLRFEYDAALLREDSVAAFGRGCLRFLAALLQTSDLLVGEVDPLSPEERHLLLGQLNDTAAPVPLGTMVHELFERAAERAPASVAAVQGPSELTYAELRAQVHRLASFLRRQGVGPGTRVGLLLEHSLDVPVAILGVLEAGGAYVPFDPAVPGERLSFMLEDAKIGLLLTQKGLAERPEVAAVQRLRLDADRELLDREPDGPLAPAAGPHDPAYVIYTSGSTGRPKGVVIPHAALVNYVWWAKDAYLEGESLAFPLYSTLAFDLTVTSIFVPLVTGNRLHVYAARDGEMPLFEVLRDDRVGVLKLTPSHLALLKDRDNRGSHISRLIVGGEALETGLARQVRQSFGGRVRIFNEYGPTEATVGCMIHELDPERDDRSHVPIGRPIANTRIYLLDPHLRPMGILAAGELYIAGAGVAQGYLGREDLTAERFLDDPFVPGERMYRTGDLARWLPDGIVDFIGRGDEQVKLRGFRLELNEIRWALTQHPRIRDGVAVLSTDEAGHQVIVAYYVAREPLSTKELREFLAGYLIEETIPSYFIHLRRLPLTLNGKVNMAALPPLSEARKHLQRDFVAPRNSVEELMAGIFAQVLGIKQVGIHESFFELGGHSLLATQVMSRVRDIFHVDLSLRVLFEAPSVARLSRSVDEARAAGQGFQWMPIVRVERDRPLPLSFAQERLWFLDQLEPGSPAYNVPAAFRIDGPLDLERMARVLTELVRRHEVLRTALRALEGTPEQVILPAAPFPLALFDLSALPEAISEEEVRRLVDEERGRGFDLGAGSPLRASVLRLAGQDHLALLTMHHVVSDAWSMEILVQELAVLYEAFGQGRPSPLPELPIQYADFSSWQRDWLESGILQAQLDYWRRNLAPPLPLLELPADRPRPAMQSTRGSSVASRLLGPSLPRFRSLVETSSVTSFIALVAAYQVLLCRYSGQTDVLIGTPIANRSRVELTKLIGFFVNTLVLRTNLDDDPGFKVLLERVRETALEAYANQDVPFERVVQEIQPERRLSHNPLFQVLFDLHKATRPQPEFAALAWRPLTTETRTAKFDLSLTVVETADGLTARLEHNLDLFDGTTAARLLSHLAALLEDIVASPERRASELLLLTGAERFQLLLEWNATAADFGADLCAHDLIEQQAARTPGAVAVVHEEDELAYGELDSRANQLAHRLRRMGIGREDRVGVYMERSLDMIVGLLGVLKAGGAYVPLDPSYPPERLAYLIEDSGPSLLLTHRALAATLPTSLPVLFLDAERDALDAEPSGPVASGVTPANLAYTVYTSGSTGRPKGAMVTHRGLVNAYRGWEQEYGLRPLPTRHLQMASFSFDVFSGDLVRALGSGGTLVLCPREVLLAPDQLLHLMLRRGVDSAEFVPAVVKALLRHVEETGQDLAFMRRLVVGSDVWHVRELRHLERFLGPETRLISSYGVSEATIDSSYTESGRVRCHAEAVVPIGRPFPNNRLHVLDRELQPSPIGVPGELFLGGAGLARGYLNRPDLTAAAFVPDPCGEEPGARLYRTGDRARFLPDSEVEFLGRADHQVKIRGFRIEPGEIEAALKESPLVREAVVVPFEDRSGKRLVAYLVAGPMEPGARELRELLRERLPDYMVPSAFVYLERLPLTPNGKVDRRSLPAPDTDREVGALSRDRTPAEGLLAAIWSEVLGVDEVGVEHNFFHLGGHSLTATQVISRVRKAFRVELPLRAVFEAPTLEAQAAAIGALMKEGGGLEAPPIEPVDRSGPLPLSFAQQRLWFLDRLQPGNPFYNVPTFLQITGPLRVEVLESCLREMVRRHEVLRTRFTIVDDQPAQVIASPAPRVLPVVDLSGLVGEARHGEQARLSAVEARRPFDLERQDVMKALLLRSGPEEHLAMLVMHHIATDAWSSGIFVEEMASLYQAFARALPSPLPELPVQYGDFAHWQRQWFQGEVQEAQLGYWREQLRGAPARLDLPTDHQRPAIKSFRGATLEAALPASLSEGLKGLCRSAQVTLFMALLAGLQALLHRVTGQEDLCVGTPIAGRNRLEIERLIGFFVNTLVMRVDVSGDPAFAALLARVRNVVLEGHARQDLPFERLVEELQPERSLNTTPLFQVWLALQNTPQQEVEISGLRFAPLRSELRTAKFDLALTIQESPQGLLLWLEYSEDLFEKASMMRLLGHLREVLTSAVGMPGLRLSELALLSPAERNQVIHEWNDTKTDFPRQACLHELFEEQVERTPEAVAAVLGGQRLSYRELNRKANRFAHELLARGVERGERVALLSAHSLETLASLLGVLKAGAAYLPLDPGYPAARLEFVLRDAGVRRVLTQEHLLPRLPDGDLEVLLIDGEPAPDREAQNPRVPAGPGDLAYVIYTSGSTGQPKGVEVAHGSAVNYIWWAREVYMGGEPLSFALYSSLSFDLTVTSIFAPLLSGGRAVVFPSGERLSPIPEVLGSGEVDIVKLTPSHLALVKERDNRGSRVRRLIVGGEALRADLARSIWDSFGGNVEIFNEYGPTEATVGCMIHRFEPLRDLHGSVSIGRPAANTAVYVLDGHGNPVPAHVTGELCIAGDGVAEGYLKRPELTAERFSEDPFVAGRRMYRSGDLARFRADGRVEFLGRRDEQVKFHGYRIELNEIRSAVNEHPQVRDSVVMVRKDGRGEPVLVAYYVARQALEPAALRASLLERILEETIPNVFVHLRRLPLTLNGKINYAALPDLDEAKEKLKKAFAPARTATEQAASGVFAQVLGVREVGIYDNFFDLGGHSLLATQVISRIRELFGLELPLRELFEHPTAARLAEGIDRARAAGGGLVAPSFQRIDRNQPIPLSFAQQRLWFLHQLEPDNLAFNVPVSVQLLGSLDVAVLERCLAEIIRRHEVLRTVLQVAEGQPVQVINPVPTIEMPVVDLTGLATPEETARRMAEAEGERPFDLRGPLLRWALLRLTREDHVLLFSMHHIVCDGWSMGVLVRELTELYGAISQGAPSPLPELAFQYADFSHWQRRYLAGEILQAQVAYWRRQLLGAPPLLALPTYQPRPAVRTFHGMAEQVALPGSVLAALWALGREESSTLFMVLLSTFKVLLHQYTGQNDIVVGTTHANRNRREIEDLIGIFINHLVLRTNLSDASTFRQVLRRVRAVVLGAEAHQDLSFDKLVEELRIERSPSYTPVFQVLFVLQSFSWAGRELPGLRAKPFIAPASRAKYDLTVFVAPEGGALRISFEYNADLFEGETMRRMLRQYVALLEHAAQSPDAPLLSLAALEGGDTREMVADFTASLEDA